MLLDECREKKSISRGKTNNLLVINESRNFLDKNIIATRKKAWEKNNIVYKEKKVSGIKKEKLLVAYTQFQTSERKFNFF